MTRMVSQILWEHCMGELGIDGNNYENDTFAVRSYDWVDEDKNEWHFWHKPSGLKVEWYKYPLRGFEVNMDITDDQFLDVLRDCTNSMEDGKAVRFLHDIRRWWADRKTENSSEIPNNSTISKMEQVEDETRLTAKCLNCNNSKVCKEKHWDGCVYEPKDEKTCETCRHWKYIAHEWQCEACKCQGYEPKDEPQTEERYTFQDEQEYNDRWQTDCAWK